MATPHYMDIMGLIEGTNFEIIEQHHIRMHKSLTRVITLFKKTDLIIILFHYILILMY